MNQWLFFSALHTTQKYLFTVRWISDSNQRNIYQRFVVLCLAQNTWKRKYLALNKNCVYFIWKTSVIDAKVPISKFNDSGEWNFYFFFVQCHATVIGIAFLSGPSAFSTSLDSSWYHKNYRPVSNWALKWIYARHL